MNIFILIIFTQVSAHKKNAYHEKYFVILIFFFIFIQITRVICT